MLLDLSDKGIGKDLFIYDKRELLPTEYLLHSGIIETGDTVLDIGANIGYYALLESELVGATGKVFAVEPVSRNLEMLRRNVGLNNCGNVELFRLAFGDKTTKSKIYITDYANLCSMKNHNPSRIVGEEEVEVTTVDSFLADKRVPNFVRMDVEGYEYNIIKGMKQTLAENITLFMEVHGHLMPPEQIREIFTTLRENSFKVDFASVDRGCIPPNNFALACKGKVRPLPEILRMNLEELEALLIERKLVIYLFTSNFDAPRGDIAKRYWSLPVIDG